MSRSNYTNRDDNGYRVPQPKTRSRRVYDLCIVNGISQTEAAAMIGMNVVTLRVLLWKIRNPGVANATERNNRKVRKQ